MKLYLVAIITVGLMVMAGQKQPEIVATASMDGKGHYRLTNYQIDKDGCLLFTDFIGERVHFCGSYKLKTVDEYRREGLSIQGI